MTFNYPMVNILEELSNTGRTELDDLRQDFRTNPNYNSLDPIGLGKPRERDAKLEVLEKNINLISLLSGSGHTDKEGGQCPPTKDLFPLLANALTTPVLVVGLIL